MSNILEQQQNYWLVKEGNEFEYTDQYYIYGSLKDINNKLQDIIKNQFDDNIDFGCITKGNNKIWMFVDNVLNYPLDKKSKYQFDEFDITAIKRPKIKSSKYLKHECYDATNNMELMNGA